MSYHYYDIPLGKLISNRFAEDHNLNPKEVYRLVKAIESIVGTNNIEETIIALGDQLLQWYKCSESTLRNIKARINAAYHFTDPYLPVYDVSDLQILVKGYIDHFKDNRQSFIKTGYPALQFKLSPWMSANLDKLYPIKVPNIYPFLGNNHAWFRRIRKTISKRKIEYCDYEKADVMDFLSADTAERLERMRTRIYQSYLLILAKVLRCLEGADFISDYEVISDCAKDLNKEEVSYLLASDNFYIENNFIPIFHGDSIIESTSGGLSDLIRLVSRINIEIRHQLSNRYIDFFGKNPEDGVGINFDIGAFFEKIRDLDDVFFDRLLFNELNPSIRIRVEKRLLNADILNFRKSISFRKLIFDTENKIIIFNSKEYVPTERHFWAVLIMYTHGKEPGFWVSKDKIADLLRLPTNVTDYTLNKWFKNAGGDQKRLLETGLIEQKKSKHRLNNNLFDSVEIIGDVPSEFTNPL